jgi:hypothetical protein
MKNNFRLISKIQEPGKPAAALPAFVYIPSFPLLIPMHMLMRGMRSMH